MRKKVILVCISGISTGLIVHNLQELANEQSITIDFFSSSVSDAEENMRKYDVSACLISPQVKNIVENIIAYSKKNKIPVDYINEEDFITLNSSGILATTERMLKI